MGTPTLGTKFTYSCWVKRSALGSAQTIASMWSDSSTHIVLRFDLQDNLSFYATQSSTYPLELETNAVFRDTSAWYHIVAKVDTTQSTSSDRCKLYVNGSEQTSLSASTYPSQDSTFTANASGTTHYVGGRGDGSYWDGLITHAHFTDGYAYDASTFGESDSVSSIWKPKTAPSVTYGTNGFFLKMENSGAMGTDSSGNSNTFTVSGTLTQNVDTPSNNFPTISTNMNPYNTPDILYGNLRVGGSSTNDYSPCADKGVITGKWYWEVKMVNANNTRNIGIVRADKANISNLYGFYIASTGNNTTTAFTCGLNGGNGQVYNKADGSQVATDISASLTTDDIVGIALDLTSATKTIQFYKNGSAAGSAITLDNAFVDDFILPGARVDTNQDIDFNFGQGYFGVTAVASANADGNGIGAFEYAVPSGFYAICTKNIKEFG
jgi:hypothetical protein